METITQEDLAAVRKLGRAIEKAVAEQNDFLMKLREKYDAPSGWFPSVDGKWQAPQR